MRCCKDGAESDAHAAAGSVAGVFWVGVRGTLGHGSGRGASRNLLSLATLVAVTAAKAPEPGDRSNEHHRAKLLSAGLSEQVVECFLVCAEMLARTQMMLPNGEYVEGAVRNLLGDSNMQRRLRDLST